MDQIKTHLQQLVAAIAEQTAEQLKNDLVETINRQYDLTTKTVSGAMNTLGLNSPTAKDNARKKPATRIKKRLNKLKRQGKL